MEGVGGSVVKVDGIGLLRIFFLRTFCVYMFLIANQYFRRNKNKCFKHTQKPYKHIPKKSFHHDFEYIPSQPNLIQKREKYEFVNTRVGVHASCDL